MAGKDSKTKSPAQSDSEKKEGDKEKETQEHCNVFMDITIDSMSILWPLLSPLLKQSEFVVVADANRQARG